MAPVRGTKPKVGRRPVVPQRVEGDEIDPRVSEPMAKATQPAAVAEAPVAARMARLVGSLNSGEAAEAGLRSQPVAASNIRKPPILGSALGLRNQHQSLPRDAPQTQRPATAAKVPSVLQVERFAAEGRYVVFRHL